MTLGADLCDEIQPAPISTVTSAIGAKAKVMGMGCAKFMGADGELVGLKNVVWMPNLCANLILTGRLGDETETIGSERYHAYNDTRIIWDLRCKGDVHKRMWQIPVFPWHKSANAAAEASMEKQYCVQIEELIGASAAVNENGDLGPSVLGDLAPAICTCGCLHIGVDAQGEVRARPASAWNGTAFGGCEACMQNKFVRFPFPRAEGLVKARLEVVHMDIVAIQEDWLPIEEWQSMRPVKVLRSDRGEERVLTHVGEKHWVSYERWLGKKPTIDMLRVWGCMGLMMVPKDQRHKLEVADVWAVHLGMAPDSNEWLMWEPKSKKMLVNRNVKIVEDVMYKDWQQQQRVQISLRLQKIERSAVEEVQLHLDDLPGSELTSDHNGGGEQQVAGPAVEASLDLQDVQGRVTVALQGEAGKPMLIPDVLYVPGVQANLLLAGQLKENDVKLQEDGDGMLLVLAAGDMLDRAKYIGLATGLDIKLSTGTESPCVSCVSSMLARHTFPDKGSNTKDALAVVHINLCRPFRVAAKDSNLYLLLLKDRKTRYVWVRPVAKKSLVLRELEKWLVVAERQMKKSVLMLRSDRGVEFLFLVPEQQRGGKLKLKARRGVLRNHVAGVLEVGARAGIGMDAGQPADGHLDCDTPITCRADLPRLTLTSASSDEGSNGASLVALAKSITRGQRDVTQSTIGQSAEEPTTGEKLAWTPTMVQEDVEDSEAGDDRAEQLGAEESTDSNVMEVPLGPRRSGRTRRPLDFLSYHACLPPAAFTMVYDEVDDDLLYDDAEEDVDLPKLDPNMQADPEHRWDIALMTVKEVLARWKGKVVKAAMDEEIRSLVSKDTWGINYDETYALMSSCVTMRIFLGIITVLHLNLMQIDMKNAFLQSKLDWVLYMYQLGYYNDETGWVCKLLKSLYGLKQSPLLWYRALNGVLMGAS
ncbi:unnamed protein product [Closterium sp. NIES-54]